MLILALLKIYMVASELKFGLSYLTMEKTKEETVSVNTRRLP